MADALSPWRRRAATRPDGASLKAPRRLVPGLMIALVAVLEFACSAPKPTVEAVAAPIPPPPPPVEPPPPPPPPSSEPPPVRVEGKEPEALKAHHTDVWLPKRAERLGMDVETAKARDASFSVGPPADGLWWDAQLAEEVYEVWTGLCSECHQGKRKKAKVMAIAAPGPHWADKKSRFFKLERVPKETYRIVVEGQRASLIDAKDMPGWSGKLSNEQMWGLVYFIVSASQKKNHDLQ